jgi:hypothetical protein
MRCYACAHTDRRTHARAARVATSVRLTVRLPPPHRSLSLPVNELQCVPLSAKARVALTVYEGPECGCEDLSCRSGSA